MRSALFEGIGHRAARLGVAIAVVSGLGLMAGSAPVLAAGEAHPFLSEFGRTATEPFSNPNGIAIDETTGDVYVADIGTDTVYRFDANGDPVDFSALTSNQLTGTGTPAGSFAFPPTEEDTPAAIAVDNSTNSSDPSRGDLYVMDAGHGVIDKFGPDGEYLSQIAGFEAATGSAEHELLGIAVDPNGIVRAVVSSVTAQVRFTTGVSVEEFDDSAANHLIAQQHDQEPSGHLTGVPDSRPGDGFAIGPTGDDYMIFRQGGGGLCSCTAKLGQQLAGLGLIDNYESGDVAIAADPASGHVYTDEQSTVAEWDNGAINGSKAVPSSFQNYGAGTLVARFGEGQLSGSSGQGGIAVDGSTGEIYVSDPTNGKVDVFGSDAPAVSAGSPTNITKESATLNGTVNPRGEALSSCEIEYGMADEFGQVAGEHYEHSSPCEPGATGIGADSSPVAVSLGITGLQAGLLYRFRIVAANAAGSSQSAGLLATEGPGFGLKSFELSFVNEDGSADTQAGSHPYEMRNNMEFNSHFIPAESNADSIYLREPDGTLRDLAVDLPPGLVGDPNATPKKCTLDELLEGRENQASGGGGCPPESLLGIFEVNWDTHVFGYDKFIEPVYNMVPPHGDAVQFGIEYAGTQIFISSSLLAGGDYPVQAAVIGAPPEAPVLRTQLTIKGVLTPCARVQAGSGKYTNSSCTSTGNGGEFESELARSKAFLTLPTGCNGPLRTTVSVDSYEEPGHWAHAEALTRNSAGAPVSLTGCSKLIFPPTISVSPDTTDASSSSGLTVDVHVPQGAASNPAGLAESSLRDTTVTLPQGVSIDPSGADGLQACSEGLAGFTGFSEFNPEFEPGVKWNTFTPTVLEALQPGTSFCPDGSKIGTVKIKTPLLEHELEGAVYLASQNANPFNGLIAMYLVAEDPVSGSVIKLAGEVSLTESGQIITTFKNTPDLPFEDLQLHFFGGERAPLSTPSRCGKYTTQAVFTPWDGNGPVTASSSFDIEHGPGGSPCPGASLPFEPSLTAGTTSNQAGGFTPFTMTMSREDGQQNLSSIELHMPPGLSGTLANVKLCPEAQANEGTCPEDTLIGETTVSVGLGGDPFTVKGGKVYITEKYEGAPFGLSIVNPAKAGPFDVEDTPAKHPTCDCLVVRAKIEVDPLTAALTITSNPPGTEYSIPTIIEGIPLEIRHVNVTINHLEDFTFNPTDCNKMAITGTLLSTESSSDQLSLPFQVTNCAALSFKPGFAVSTQAKTSRANGASLTAKLTYPNVGGHSVLSSGQANIARVKVELPKQLPSRLSTLQKACTAKVFDANPAACPSASKIGFAKATTPLLPGSLEGPAYFVSNGSAKFPELIVVLSGYQGVTVDLHGETFISKAGITSSTFASVPDVPVGTFELTLPEGPNSALAANGDLCAASLAMPTEFLAQSGVVIHQSTAISVSGCKKTIRVVKHKKKAKGKKASITVRVPSAGKLVAGGAGLSGVMQSASKAGEVTVELSLSKYEQHMLVSHHGRMLAAHVKLTFTPSHGETLTSSVMVLFH